MSVTCQAAIAAATNFSTANIPLTQDTAEMIGRLRAEVRALYVEILDTDPDYLTTAASYVTGSDQTVLRTYVLPESMWVLRRVEHAGQVVTRVEPGNLGAEMPPRYLVRGRTLVEPALGEWGDGILTLTTARAPVDLDPNGSPAQTLDIPDAWLDVLVVPLARYLAAKDLGRPETEVQMLDALASARKAAFLTWIAAQGGTVVRSAAPRTNAGQP